MGDFNLRKKYSNSDKQTLRYLMLPDRNWFKEQKFPLIHKIIFGLSKQPLANELMRNPNAIFEMDAKGRTALDWATARAQLEDNPNSLDITGGTIIMHAEIPARRNGESVPPGNLATASIQILGVCFLGFGHHLHLLGSFSCFSGLSSLSCIATERLFHTRYPCE